MIAVYISPGTVAVCATVAIAMGVRCALWIGKIKDRNAQKRKEKHQRIDTLCHGSHRRCGPAKRGEILKGGFMA